MYLGVHTPWDVLASIGIATLVIILLEPFFSNEKKFRRAMPYVIAAIVAVSAGYMIYSGILYYGTPNEINFVKGYESGCMLVGCALGFIPVYIIDTKYTNFSTGGKWYSQIIKVAVGIAITVGLKSLLKLAFLPLMGQFYERALRYFIIVVFAGAVWPLTFKFPSPWLCIFLGKLDEVDYLRATGKLTGLKTIKNLIRFIFSCCLLERFSIPQLGYTCNHFKNTYT